MVNEEAVTLADYQEALAQFQVAQSDISPKEATKRVLDDLIEQMLLAQAAAEAGFVVDEAMLGERIAQLAAQIGGTQVLSDWQAANGYTDEGFRREFARAVAAAWMRDQIIAIVPNSTEQVHARQILLHDSANVRDVYNQLQTGSSFDILAAIYDPTGLGDLGWFPRGYLAVSEVESVAFSLQPGEYSAIIETSLGFHIIQVVDYLPDRPLDPDAKLVLQGQVLKAWLQEQREMSDIVILLL